MSLPVSRFDMGHLKHSCMPWNEPQVQVDYSRCVFIFAQRLTKAASHFISQSSKLHQTEWAYILFHNLHRDSLLGSALTSSGNVGAAWAESYACTIRIVMSCKNHECTEIEDVQFWLTSNFTFCRWILWLGSRLCKVKYKRARNIGSWKLTKINSISFVYC